MKVFKMKKSIIKEPSVSRLSYLTQPTEEVAQSFELFLRSLKDSLFTVFRTPVKFSFSGFKTPVAFALVSHLYHLLSFLKCNVGFTLHSNYTTAQSYRIKWHFLRVLSIVAKWQKLGKFKISLNLKMLGSYFGGLTSFSRQEIYYPITICLT